MERYALEEKDRFNLFEGGVVLDDISRQTSINCSFPSWVRKAYAYIVSRELGRWGSRVP